MVMGRPQGATTMLHGSKSGAAYEVPHRRVEGVRGEEEQEGREVQGDGVNGLGELLTNGNSNGACPKHMLAGGMCGGDGGGSNTTWAAPRAEVSAGKRVNAKAPQCLLDSVIARQAPDGAKRPAKGGEGGSSSRGGAAEGKLNVRLVTGSTHRGGGVVQVCCECAHRDGGGSGAHRRGDGRGEPGEGGEGRWGGGRGEGGR